MCQAGIITFLKKNRAKWYSSNELSKALRVSKPSINRCLGRMRKHDEVKEKKMKTLLRSRFGFIKKAVPFYAYKRT